MDATQILAQIATALALISSQISSTTPPSSVVPICEATVSTTSPASKFADCLTQERGVRLPATEGRTNSGVSISDPDQMAYWVESELSTCMSQ